MGVPPPVSLVSVYYILLVSLGVIITFLPLHLLGYNTQPRRVPEYPAAQGGWNFLSSLGSGVTILSILTITLRLPPGPLFLSRVLHGYRRGEGYLKGKPVPTGAK